MAIKKALIFSYLFFNLVQCQAPQQLKNVGNSCFMNATLQCLSALASFNEMICPKKGTYNAQSLAHKYIEFKESLGKNKGVLDTTAIAQAGWRALGLPQKSQQDAEQFLLALLNDAFKAKEAVHEFDLINLFQTSISTELSAFDLTVRDKIFEEALPFSLSIQPGNISLEDTLASHFGYAEIDYKPENSEFVVTCEQKIRFEETSQYLALTLKRQNQRALSFPLLNLDLKQYFADQTKDKGTYDLVGVIMYSGNGKGGHYTSYVNINDHWYYCNDERITAVPQDEITAIAQRGFGTSDTVIPTVFIYELSHLRRQAIKPGAQADDLLKIAALEKAVEHAATPKIQNSVRVQPSQPIEQEKKRPQAPSQPAVAAVKRPGASTIRQRAVAPASNAVKGQTTSAKTVANPRVSQRPLATKRK